MLMLLLAACAGPVAEARYPEREPLDPPRPLPPRDPPPIGQPPPRPTIARKHYSRPKQDGGDDDRIAQAAAKRARKAAKRVPRG